MKSKPQRKAVIVRLYTTNPKKPNSAQRKVSKIKFTNQKFANTAVKGIKHNLKKFSKVWIQGVGYRDTPVVKTRLIIGKESFLPLNNITERRSIYGIRKS